MNERIAVQSLSKSYFIGRVQPNQMLRDLVSEFVRRPFARRGNGTNQIWALQDVNFDVPNGEVVGIIGRNGAGKSTLLKILSRITHPTSGTVRVKGRVASLLEVGTGFHEELTGRENVYLNGSILGMKKREVDRHFDAIVDYAGVEQFIDTPIKRYSSGMRLRLGFAVAAHLEPDVLIVDEVLAVGDAGFQKKCLKTMDGLRGGGRTVLFVSHNMAAVENLCSRGIWIDEGRLRMDGAAKDVIESYLSSFVGDLNAGADLADAPRLLGSGEIRYTKVEFLSPEGLPCGAVRSGDALVLRFHYQAKEVVPHPSFGFRLYTGMGTLITETSTRHHGLDLKAVGPGSGAIDLEIDLLNLLPGRYSLSLWITAAGGNPVYDGDVRTTLDVEVSDVYASGRLIDSQHGILYFPQRWRVDGA